MKLFSYFLILLALISFSTLGWAQPQAVPSYQRAVVETSSSLPCTTTQHIPLRPSLDSNPCSPITTNSVNQLFKNSHLSITKLSPAEIQQTQGGFVVIETAVVALAAIASLMWTKHKIGSLMEGVVGSAAKHGDELAGEVKKPSTWDQIFHPEKVAREKLESPTNSPLLKGDGHLEQQKKTLNTLVGHVNEVALLRKKMDELSNQITKYSPTTGHSKVGHQTTDPVLANLQTEWKQGRTELTQLFRKQEEFVPKLTHSSGAVLVEIKNHQIATPLIFSAMQFGENKRVAALQPITSFRGLDRIKHIDEQGEIYAKTFHDFVKHERKQTHDMLKMKQPSPLAMTHHSSESLSSPRLSARTLSDGSITPRSTSSRGSTSAAGSTAPPLCSFTHKAKPSSTHKNTGHTAFKKPISSTVWTKKQSPPHQSSSFITK